METAIEVKGLTKFYGKFKALNGVSLNVSKGEVHGLIGPNGAGKTTLIKCVLGITSFSEGEVKIAGKAHHEAHAKLIVGYLPEEARLYSNLTGEENLDFFGRLLGMDKKVRRQRVGELLEFVGLKDAGGKLARTYSKGMLQRLSIAQALLNDPEIVILDEPTSGLDPLGRLMVVDVIKNLKKQGRTVIMSTHILPDVEAVCDRFTLIHLGRIRRSGMISEIAEEGGKITVRWKDREGEVHETSIHQDEVWNLIEEVKGKNGKILSITPERKRLEDVFREIAEG